ncbi:MAG: hypothetical protein BWY02_02785 [bacterium ADurb.Bin157]|nr:MAG: hypothetical protein BWY02_02785 [bacterium ADurb.Bin157]
MEINELNFFCKVTHVYRKNIDLLIKLSDEHMERSLQVFFAEEPVFDKALFEASSYISDSPRIAFSLYALAIVHCYSLVENNRKDILMRLPGLSAKQKKGLYKIKIIDDVLSSFCLAHNQVNCYDVAEEFRLVNNEIKHDRYNLSTKISLKNGIAYDANALRELYLAKSQCLEEYLSDLYRQVSAVNTGHFENTPKL